MTNRPVGSPVHAGRAYRIEEEEPTLYLCTILSTVVNNRVGCHPEGWSEKRTDLAVRHRQQHLKGATDRSAASRGPRRESGRLSQLAPGAHTTHRRQRAVLKADRPASMKGADHRGTEAHPKPPEHVSHPVRTPGQRARHRNERDESDCGDPQQVA